MGCVQHLCGGLGATTLGSAPLLLRDILFLIIPYIQPKKTQASSSAVRDNQEEDVTEEEGGGTQCGSSQATAEVLHAPHPAGAGEIQEEEPQTLALQPVGQTKGGGHHTTVHLLFGVERLRVFTLQNGSGKTNSERDQNSRSSGQ